MNDLNFTDKFRCGTQGGVEQKYNYYDDGSGVRGLMPKIKEILRRIRTAVAGIFKKR